MGHYFNEVSRKHRSIPLSFNDKHHNFLYTPPMETVIREKLTPHLKPTVLEIVDDSHKHAGHAGARPGGNSHFSLYIVSDVFTPLNRIERHRLVHDLLKEELVSQIHALALTLRSPDEVQGHGR